jgi:hypothetical protein
MIESTALPRSYRSRIVPVEDLVAVAVEVLDVEDRDDVVQDVVVEEDAAEDPELRLEILGGRRSINAASATGGLPLP